MTLISLCSYSQRDYTKIPFYFFMNSFDSLDYYVAEVIGIDTLSNGKTVERLSYFKNYNYYYDYNQTATVIDLAKNKDYKICYRKNGKLVNIYISTALQEPVQFLSLDINFKSNKDFKVYFDKNKQYYLFTETTK